MSDNRTNAYTVRYNDGEASLVVRSAEATSLEVASWIRMVSIVAARESGSRVVMPGSWQARALALRRQIARLEEENQELRRELHGEECIVKVGGTYISTWMFKPRDLVPGHVFKIRRKKHWMKIDEVEVGTIKTVHAHWVGDVKVEGE